jgi:hypothetical protein
MKLQLPQVTLLGIDCVDSARLIQVAEICTRDIEFGAVKLLTDRLVKNRDAVKIPNIPNLRAYSHFVVKKLHDYVDTDYVLLFQHDGFILNAKAWKDEFLKYDYIGAPWWYADGLNVGNGGFSLRSKKLLSLVQKDKRIVQHHPEDHHICRTYRPYLEAHGMRFAPETLATQFSIEGKSREHDSAASNTWHGQFGFHGLDKVDISAWLIQHPEESTIANVLSKKYRRERVI